jgi:hypothetical protein
MIDPVTPPSVLQPREQELHVLLERGTLKIGTCEHCVVREPGRPARAWNANGDAELDFDRDALLAALTRLGVETTIVEEYVCP